MAKTSYKVDQFVQKYISRSVPDVYKFVTQKTA